MYWFEWDVAISNIEGTIRPDQVTITWQPWVTRLSGSWEQFTVRSYVSVLSDKGNLYGCEVDIKTNHSSQDRQIEPIAFGSALVATWLSLLLTIIYGLHWLFSASYLYKKERGFGLLVIFATAGYCLFSLVILVGLGPSTSVGMPLWMVALADPDCAGTITLQASLAGLREGAFVFLGGSALILIALALHPYWWIMSKRSQVSTTNSPIL